MTRHETPGDRPRILLYAMYDTTGPLRGPAARIERMRAALAVHSTVSVISGTRSGRVRRILDWLGRAGFGSVDAVYVEAASSFATPVDLAFLALARVRGKPVGVFFRDAYQLFRAEYPLTRRRQHLLDWLWHLSTPTLKRVASQRFAPSEGLARVLHLDAVKLLPPGADPGLPDLGYGASPIVAYIGSLSRSLGVDLLIDAVRTARGQVPNCRLRLISPAPPEAVFHPAAESEFIEWRPAGLPELAEALTDVRVCVIPFRIRPYTNLAVPLKLFDYLGYGKPIVATECTETARILAPTGAGILVTDTSAALADAIVKVLTDDELANQLAHRARALAQAPGMSWDARARTVLASLLPREAR